MTVMLSGALRGAADKVKEKMFKIAGHLLEANTNSQPSSVRADAGRLDFGAA